MDSWISLLYLGYNSTWFYLFCCWNYSSFGHRELFQMAFILLWHISTFVLFWICLLLVLTFWHHKILMLVELFETGISLCLWSYRWQREIYTIYICIFTYLQIFLYVTVFIYFKLNTNSYWNRTFLFSIQDCMMMFKTCKSFLML